MYNETLWITGADGRLGSSLVRAFEYDLDYKVFGTDKDVDITDSQVVEKYAMMYRPSIIVNCASISDLAYCESHRLEAYKVNALGARNLAAAASMHNSKIIHFSTDDVFNGEHERAKNEFDTPTPQSIYGLSKLAGENLVRELTPKHMIIRSSWLYGIGEGDYFSYVVEKGKNNETFTAPVDRFSTPTSINEFVRFLKVLIESNEYGIMHASCEGMCSRHQFAQAILSSMGYDPNLAQPVLSGESGARTSTVLENLMLQLTGIYYMPLWEDDMKEFVDGLKGGKK